MVHSIVRRNIIDPNPRSGGNGCRDANGAMAWTLRTGKSCLADHRSNLPQAIRSMGRNAARPAPILLWYRYCVAHETF
jgi:hypothetical protein